MMIDENMLENMCLDWFRDNGWDVRHGRDISPNSNSGEREEFSDVILKQTLKNSLEKINSHATSDHINEAINIITRAKSLDLHTNNQEFHQLLRNGVKIPFTNSNGERDEETIFIADFENIFNNNFTVANQVTIKEHKRKCIPDIICYLNGLPIAVIELKSPNDDKVDIDDAFNQIQYYQENIPELFIYNEALIISDGFDAQIGSLTANIERFMPWRTVKNETDKPTLQWQLETLVHGFFDCELLLDYLYYFIIFESDNETITKKIAGYHQFHAVRNAVEATIKAKQKNSNQAGVVWHTQGSGKSISMCCLAGKLQKHPAMANPTIIIVTDRNDLDGQLAETFANAQYLLSSEIVKIEDRDDLREKLKAVGSGGVIFTTIQKFSTLNNEQQFPVLSYRNNIVVISDEAHRSQYGLKKELRNGKFTVGYAKHLRDALPNAAFMGFTGTPIAQEDKDTRAVFGDYVSVYDIKDAVADKTTVEIYYESRLAKLDLNYKEIAKLSRDAEELFEDEEDTATKEHTKQQWSCLEKLMGAKPRIEIIAKDLVEHYEKRTSTIDGKAMIVAMSRNICAELYSEITRLRPDWHNSDPEKGAIKVIMTGSSSDREILRPHVYSKTTKKALEKRFKDPEDELKLVIVRDMWLTGFDAPCCHTMYIDKPMKGHNLMQAIARVNRVFKDKPGGLVVDYIGIANELKDALKTYTDANGKGDVTLNAKEALNILLEKIDTIRGMFAKTVDNSGFDISNFEGNITKALLDATNYILGLNDGKKRFLDLALAANKAYSLCCTLKETEPLAKEIAFYLAIKIALHKLSSLTAKKIKVNNDSILKQILNNSIIAEDVEDIFSLCGLKKPDIGLLSEEFLEDVRMMPQKNFAVELLEKLLKDNIKSRLKNNVVKEEEYIERLKATLTKYHNRAIQTSQVIEELITMAKDFAEDIKRHENLGLSSDEIAFYDALAKDEEAVRELGDKILKKIAIEVTENLRKSTTIDWQNRESVRARLRLLVKRTLKRYKYPPTKSKEAVELILKQAERLSEDWSK